MLGTVVIIVVIRTVVIIVVMTDMWSIGCILAERLGAGFRHEGLGIRVWALRFRHLGLGIRV